MKHTALFEMHKQLNGNIVDFHGWRMPLHYEHGVIKEHLTVRSSLGLFDVSHMGDFLIYDRNDQNGLQRLLTNNILSMNPGKAVYTHVLDHDGIIIDDVIVTKLSNDGKFFCVPNASMVDIIKEWMIKNADLEIIDLTQELTCIAVQGPKSKEFLKELFGEGIENVRKFNIIAYDFERNYYCDLELIDKEGLQNTIGIISGTGYTGEEGFEVIVPNRYAESVWNSLLNMNIQSEILPIGLGARDTLRLEMGYLLSGQDFNRDRTTLETNCTWVVKWDHDFIGKGRLMELRETKEHQKMIGIELEGKAPARTGAMLRLLDFPHEIVGSVSSGNFSPSLGHPIALAYVDRPHHQEGIGVILEQRGRKLRGTTTKTPFIKKK